MGSSRPAAHYQTNGSRTGGGICTSNFRTCKTVGGTSIDKISSIVPVKPLEISIFLLDSQLLKAFIRLMLIQPSISRMTSRATASISLIGFGAPCEQPKVLSLAQPPLHLHHLYAHFLHVLTRRYGPETFQVLVWENMIVDRSTTAIPSLALRRMISRDLQSF